MSPMHEPDSKVKGGLFVCAAASSPCCSRCDIEQAGAGPTTLMCSVQDGMSQLLSDGWLMVRCIYLQLFGCLGSISAGAAFLSS